MQVFTAAKIASNERKEAQLAWNLLTDGHGSVPYTDTPVAFLKCFFRLFEAVRARHQIPRQISIKVRASYDKAAKTAYKAFKLIYTRHVSVTKVLSRIHGEYEQGHVLVALLELLMDKRRFTNAQSIVKELLKVQGQIRSFRLVEAESMANLLATFVRTFPHLERTRDDILPVLYFFNTLVGFSELRTPILFDATIAKLEGLEVPLCLGLFLSTVEILADADEKCHCSLVQEFLQCMHSRYSTPGFACAGTSSLPFFSIIDILLLRGSPRDPFLQNMHCRMEGINEGEWGRTWRDLGLEQEYNHQRGLVAKLNDIYQWSTINAGYGR